MCGTLVYISPPLLSPDPTAPSARARLLLLSSSAILLLPNICRRLPGSPHPLRVHSNSPRRAHGRRRRTSPLSPSPRPPGLASPPPQRTSNSAPPIAVLRAAAAGLAQIHPGSRCFAVPSVTVARVCDHHMEGGRMDQTCMAAISSQPFVADVEPVKKAGGDIPVATGSGCFDCNICLDFAAEPVVTLCGHLYCWPCIYEWLRPGVESTASDTSSSARRQCPVCKATLSPDTLVPLYGRGGSSKKSPNGMVIPRRPKVQRETIEHQNSQSHVNDHEHRNIEAEPPHQPLQHTHQPSGATEFNFIYPPAPIGRGLIHSTAGGVLGGMAEAVLPWAFRGQLPPSLYYTSPYHVSAQNGRPRLRRQELEIERSLHQIWFFLFVFVVLCLLLF